MKFLLVPGNEHNKFSFTQIGTIAAALLNIYFHFSLMAISWNFPHGIFHRCSKVLASGNAQIKVRDIKVRAVAVLHKSAHRKRDASISVPWENFYACECAWEREKRERERERERERRGRGGEW